MEFHEKHSLRETSTLAVVVGTRRTKYIVPGQARPGMDRLTPILILLETKMVDSITATLSTCKKKLQN
jgi:hypothetical protein